MSSWPSTLKANLAEIGRSTVSENVELKTGK